MWTWETGVEFGRAIEQLRHHEVRITETAEAVEQIEHAHGKLKAEVYSLRAIVIRGGLLVLLWAAGIATNLQADRLGEVMASFLKAMIK